jgi:lantibiotic modifying enzyme
MQWCHGSPGVIIALASYPRHDERVERLLVAGGQGIWQAGPLRKGPTLCHGTAGNGFALLRLAVRTGDERWQRRAECFAMHAIGQVSNWRHTFGVPSFSLWTGELGVALYVDAVRRKDADLLTLDVM